MPSFNDFINRTSNVLASPITKGIVLTATIAACLANHVSAQAEGCDTCTLIPEQMEQVTSFCKDLVINCLLQNFSGSSTEFTDVYNSQFDNEHYDCYSRTMADNPKLHELQESLRSKPGNMAASMTLIMLSGKYAGSDTCPTPYTCP